MKMTTLSVSLLALLAFAGTAMAGTEDDPEVNDDAFDAGAGTMYADIERAWIEEQDDGSVRMSVRIGFMPEAVPGTAYGMYFTANGTTYFAGLAMVPHPAYFIAEFDPVAYTIGSTTDLDGAYEVGLPGYVHIDVPRRMLNGANVLTDIGAATADIKSSAADMELFIPFDDAKASRDFTLTAPASAPGTSETSDAAAPTGSGTVAPAATAGSDASAPSSIPDDKAVPAPAMLGVLIAVLFPALIRRRAR